jgi:hypothetical protein
MDATANSAVSWVMPRLTQQQPGRQPLGPVVSLAAAAFMAAVARHPKRNIRMLHGERVIRRHDGEPASEPPAPEDPNLKSWSVHLIAGKKMQHYAVVLAASEEAAIEAAAKRYGLDDQKRKRLAVTPQGCRR